MKFMKLGSKPDTFRVVGNIRTVATEIKSDLTVLVQSVSFHLHKFPLLSKSSKLQRLVSEATYDKREVELWDIPGGVEAFELCAKFCYGITITLNAYNVMAVRCAAEYLEMTEAIEKGNLIFKVDVFLNACIFRGWKDSIIALQNTTTLSPWADDLELQNRCVDSVVSKVLVDPARVDWSYTYTRTASKYSSSEITESPPWNGLHSRDHRVPDDWWVEDIAELEIDLYRRLFAVIKSTGRISPRLLGEALQFYTLKWLPGLSKDYHILDSRKASGQESSIDHVDIATEHCHLLEKIVYILPTEKGCISCSFLLRLLKAAVILGANNPTKMELARRVGLQLDEACLNDLLIPSLSYASDDLYDVDLIQAVLEHFLMQEHSPPSSPPCMTHVNETQPSMSAQNLNFVDRRKSASSKHIKVAKLIDAYLAEIARDTHLPMSKFISLAELIPDFARPVHDGLYRAIDIYLKEHPGLTKTERKKLCRLLDCKKLSTEACMHAAQNERLPLRVVVQVLFLEQVRASSELPSNVRTWKGGQSQEGVSLEEKWETLERKFKSIQGDLTNMKLKISEVEKEHSSIEMEDTKSTSATYRKKNFLCKLWPGSSQNCCP